MRNRSRTRRSGVAGRPHGRPRRVGDLDRHLDQRQLVALDQVQQLDVEGEPVDPGPGEHEPGDVGPERLEPALGVAVAAEQHGVGQQVDDPAAQRPQPRRRDTSVRGVGVAAVADGDVPPVLDRVQDPQQLVGRVGQVGVGEGDRPAPGGQHARPAPRRPCPGCGAATTTWSAPAARAASAVPSRDPSSTTTTSSPPSAATSASAVAEAAHRVADAVGLAVGGHDDAEAQRRPAAAGGRGPALAGPGQLAEQHPPVADQPHRAAAATSATTLASTSAVGRRRTRCRRTGPRSTTTSTTAATQRHRRRTPAAPAPSGRRGRCGT